MKPRFSQFWYRVETLRPRLRTHLEIRRHIYRGQIWYVIQDTASGKIHRFTADAYAVIGLMDGNLTVQAIWEKAGLRLKDHAPTQDEVLTLLGQLHNADLLQSDVPPDAAELFRRFQIQTRTKTAQSFLNPLSIRIPLCDPDRFLTWLKPVVRPLLGAGGLICWLAVVGTALFFAAQHWPELSSNVLDRVMTPKNLLLVWLLFPFIKLFHELGHGLTAKVWGGEVHELGLMLLVFTPVPYIDVSSSASFIAKSRRMAVAAAGMMFELLLAAIALAVWIQVEPGLLRNCAYNVMLVASISTLLFNSNPLIRFDGYYILSDWLEIPNLAQRAGSYLRYLTERYGFGLSELEPPMETTAEKVWFVAYGPASWVYRLMIVVGIGLFLAEKFLIIGLVITLWSVLSMLILPFFKSVSYLMASPRLRRHRGRALAVSVTAGLGIFCVIAVVPFPLRTVVEGVVWLPEQSFVRTGTNGFVKDVVQPSGTVVAAQDTILVSEEPTIEAEEKVTLAKIAELTAQHRAQQGEDRVQTAILEEQLAQEQARLARIRERVQDLVTKGKSGGFLIVPQPEDLPGKYLKQGETIGYIFPKATVTVRAVVPQEDVSLVRKRMVQGMARFVRDFSKIHAFSLVREVPAASEHLPSRTLSVEGGGANIVDPREKSGTKTFSRTFQFDVQLPLEWSAVSVGDRVYLRFDHGYEPLVLRWWRTLRQLFLSRLDV